MTEKKSFLLYDNFYNQISFLDMEQRGALLTAIFEFRIFGAVKTQLSPITQVVFSFIKDTLERDMEAYKRRCDANRENGKKGGRPSKKASDLKTQKPKKADNDNENDNGNENEIDMDMDMEMEIDVGFSVSDGTSHPFPTARPACSPSKTKKDLTDLGLPVGYPAGGKFPPVCRIDPLTGFPSTMDSHR